MTTFTKVFAGHGVATLRPEMDFETYSEAGYHWNGARWEKLAGATKYGISAVGSRVYCQHPSAEAMMLAYDLKDGLGPRQWLQGMPPPSDLLAYFAAGGIVEAWNDTFEWEVMRWICVPRLGWPSIQRWQLSDAAAKAMAWGLPRALANAASVIGAAVQKQTDGTRLINKFSCPRQPTKGDPSTRIALWSDPLDAVNYMSYNIDDIRSEEAVSKLVPDIDGEELEFLRLTQQMNDRGVAIDLDGIRACIDVLENAYTRANAELARITSNAVTSATQNQRMRAWMAIHNVHTPSLDAEHREELLARPWPPGSPVKAALDQYDLVCAAGPRKVYTMLRMVGQDGRLANLYVYHGARTGRDTGQDAQPQNLVKAGHPVRRCVEDCGASALLPDAHDCPQCDSNTYVTEWDPRLTDATLDVFRSGRAFEVFDDPVLAVSGCIRSVFIADEDKELICSDFTSIEAVVTAALAGERWRLDAFERGDDIYLTSAGKLTGRSLDWYAQNGGKKHPDRQKYGKPMELGCGFGGWIGALRTFGFEGSDDEAKRVILAWRDASPNIVEFWGGQCRGKPWAPTSWERYGLEGAAINAVQNPGREYHVGIVSYFMHDGVLYNRLPSGRCLAYHEPELRPSDRWEGHLTLSFKGWNSNAKKGKQGWIRMDLYGGLQCENVVQALARDIFRRGVINLERAGYPVVMRTHDEPVAEVPRGWGSIEELEMHMCNVPEWARSWPIKAAGGWRGRRYRKD